MAAYAAALFHSIVAGRAATAKRLGAPPPQLSRFDLFHGHFFVTDTNISTNTNSTTGQPPKRRAQMRRLQQQAQNSHRVDAISERQAGGPQHQGQLPEVGILVSEVSPVPANTAVPPDRPIAAAAGVVKLCSG